MKSQFVSDVSHELRTPLTNIRLYLDLLQATADPAKTTRYLETMDRESGRLADLIDDLLSLSRLDAGTVSFFPTPTSLNDLLQALVEDRRALAASRGLTLVLDCEPGLPKVMGDERLLTQVFTNFLTNALNYTESGGKVTLRTRVHKEDGAMWVAAEVEDTGLGIPTDEQPLIFRRFFRGQASRQPRPRARAWGSPSARRSSIVTRAGSRFAARGSQATARASPSGCRRPTSKAVCRTDRTVTAALGAAARFKHSNDAERALRHGAPKSPPAGFRSTSPRRSGTKPPTLGWPSASCSETTRSSTAPPPRR